MKPRNGVEREIVQLVRLLPSLNESQVQEARTAGEDLMYFGGKAWCTHCGQVSEIEEKKAKGKSKQRCQHCGKLLNVCKPGKRKRVLDEKYYYAVLTTMGDYQVARTFYCTRRSERLKGHTDFSIEEVFQIWMKPGMKKVIYGRCVQGMSYYMDSWCFGKPMEIRSNHYRYEIEGYLSKSVKLLPVVKRNGIARIRADISYVDQVFGVMNDPKCEILAKAKQWSMFKRVSRRKWGEDDLWPAVRVALRHNYHIKDAGIWTDMVSMLNKCGKDIHNPKYVCPSSLKEGHDFAQELDDRRRAKEERERILRENRELAIKLANDKELEERFMNRCGAWLGIVISEGDITLKPLQDVYDFKREGDALSHCVFRAGYYKHDNCLVIGARVNGKRTETIEIDTEHWEIIQCRGKHNQPSKYHDQIVGLMKRKMNVFRKAGNDAHNRRCAASC